MMFSILLENLTKLIPRILLFILYLLSVAFFISLNSNVLSLEDVVYHPVDTIVYLYKHLKWWASNRESLGLKETLWVILSFAIPYILFRALKFFIRITSKTLLLWIKNIFSKFRIRGRKRKQEEPVTNQDLSAMKYRMMKAAEQRVDKHLEKISHGGDKTDGIGSVTKQPEK